MSMPLIFFMVSNHYPTVYGMENSWLFVPLFLVLGFGAAKFSFNKSGQKAPTLYQPAEAEAPAPAADAAKK
jgi:uncharacterized membrane protein